MFRPRLLEQEIKEEAMCLLHQATLPCEEELERNRDAGQEVLYKCTHFVHFFTLKNMLKLYMNVATLPYVWTHQSCSCFVRRMKKRNPARKERPLWIQNMPPYQTTRRQINSLNHQMLTTYTQGRSLFCSQSNLFYYLFTIFKLRKPFPVLKGFYQLSKKFTFSLNTGDKAGKPKGFSCV